MEKLEKPSNEKFKVFGRFSLFCLEYNLNVGMAGHFINKGKIPAPRKGKPNQERINLIG